MGKIKQLIGHTDEQIQLILKQLKQQSIPFKIDYDHTYVVEQVPEDELYMTIIVDESDVARVDVCLAQYASVAERTAWQKKIKKQKKAETLIFSMWIVILSILFIIIQFGVASVGTIIASIACVLLILCGLAFTYKNYKTRKDAMDMKEVKQIAFVLMLIGLTLAVYATFVLFKING